MTVRAAEAATDYDCAICLGTPEFHIHQCRNGHLFCAECLGEHVARGADRRCPTCRVALPAEPIRNLVAEKMRDARPAECAHCRARMTYGELVAHTPRCPKRAVRCSAAADGCPWSGTNANGELRAHEAACPYAICRRVVEPARRRLRELEAENRELRSRLGGPPRAMHPARGLRVTADGHWRVWDADDVFATAGLPDLRLSTGRWYYEVTVMEQATFPQLGWAREGFAPTAQVGCGDDSRSYAVDGDRGKLWHGSDYWEFGEAWREGDVVGCLLDLEVGVIEFSLNGVIERRENDDAAFENIPLDAPYFPALTMKAGLVRVNFGAEPFAHNTSEFCAVAHAAVLHEPP